MEKGTTLLQMVAVSFKPALRAGFTVMVTVEAALGHGTGPPTT
jgi:hypothetical protein